jgi:tetratricopeptide (TPR) repeat protein
VRLLFGECASKLLDPEILDRGIHELEALLAEGGAAPPERLRATRALLAIGDRNRTRLGREAAERAGEELKRGGFDAEARRDLAKRAASLLFALGDWKATNALLAREFDPANAPVDVLVTWAQATARIDGEGSATQSLALHERLLGARAAGGCLASDASERPGLLVSLARLYVTANRRDDARAVLKLLAGPVDLSPDLKRERDRLDELLKSGSPPGGG